MQPDVLTEVTSTLKFLFRDLKLQESANGQTSFTGTLRFENRDFTVKSSFNEFFPLSLPAFYLEPWDALGFIPHVSPRGFICYLSPEGTVLDRDRPGLIVKEGFDRAVDLLAAGLTGTNRWDFVDEFESYWSYLPRTPDVRLISYPGDEVATLDLAIDQDDVIWLARNGHVYDRFSPHSKISESIEVNAGLYLPLQADTYLEPPRHDQPFWAAAEIRKKLLPHVSDDTRKRLRSSVRRTSRRDFYLVVRLPRPAGGESLFGIKYSDSGTIHPLADGGTANTIAPFSVERLDSDFLARRGGAARSLAGAKVMVVGCGAVGSRVASELARAGIGSLTLVDPDELEPGNTLRHQLGRFYWGIAKARALKFALESELPFLKVEAIHKRIEQADRDALVDFSAHDLVVFATGNPTIELVMNEMISKLSSPPLSVYCWLEPLGIGGHALLVRQGAGGCFRCLYTNPDADEKGLYNKAAFAEKNQAFGQALSGCGSLFTPFGSNDAATTASLTVRSALDGLLGRELRNPLLSWRGDASQFLEEGFRLSARYGVSEQELVDNRYAYQSTACTVCGGSGPGGSAVG